MSSHSIMAPLGNQNAVGNSGGKALNNRKLAAEVRELGLTHIKRILTKPIVEMSISEYGIFNDVLTKIAPSLLPRITEITGEDGAPIQVSDEVQKEVNAALLAYLHDGIKHPTNPKPIGNKEPGAGDTAVQVPSIGA